MRKDKLIYDIKEAIRAYNKDAKITESYIVQLINTTRAEYIRQDQRRNPGEDKVNYTQTMLLDLELVDQSYISTLPVGTEILRTVKVLPQLVGKEVLKNVEVRPIDRITQEIEYMDKTRAIYGSVHGFIFAFLDDDHRIYFVNSYSNVHKLMSKVAVTAILHEPDRITDINDETETLTEYPITSSLWAKVKMKVLEDVLNTMNIAVDTVDDNQTIQ